MLRTSFHPLIQLPGPVHFSFLLSIASVPQGGENICLPPRGVARINKLQSTLNNLDKISSDRLKHCHDHSITSRCCSSKDKRAGLEISSKPPTWRVIARPKTYILIFKLSVVLYQSHLAERDFVWTHKAPELAQQKATALNH